jgi:hypothetical protein
LQVVKGPDSPRHERLFDPSSGCAIENLGRKYVQGFEAAGDPGENPAEIGKHFRRELINQQRALRQKDPMRAEQYSLSLAVRNGAQGNSRDYVIGPGKTAIGKNVFYVRC